MIFIALFKNIQTQESDVKGLQSEFDLGPTATPTYLSIHFSTPAVLTLY